MKFLITMLSALFFISCSAASPSKPVVPDATKIEKNKETALLNEISEIVRTAQSLEKLGRNMDAYRLAPDVESRRTCNLLMEDRRREIADLEARIKNLPGTYNDRLTLLLADVNRCVACSKQATESCVKARASINKTIKEIYP
ncbi:MAG: hypothetical protein ACR2HT_05310 [Pyrinomonadaceae bacterium]